MKIPFKYTFRSFKSRKLTAIITVTGIALVVFVFAAALMMAYGVEKTLISTGSPDNIKILRQSSQGEITSIIDGETQGIIRALPHIAKGSDGNLLISAEPVVIINLEIKGGGMSNVTVRGVSQSVYQLRPQIKLISGRLFNPSLRELI
ncbi:MAG: ABC transporter permease, partial [Melioribacteraceae bacterium]